MSEDLKPSSYGGPILPKTRSKIQQEQKCEKNKIVKE